MPGHVVNAMVEVEFRVRIGSVLALRTILPLRLQLGTHISIHTVVRWSHTHTHARAHTHTHTHTHVHACMHKHAHAHMRAHAHAHMRAHTHTHTHTYTYHSILLRQRYLKPIKFDIGPNKTEQDHANTNPNPNSNPYRNPNPNPNPNLITRTIAEGQLVGVTSVIGLHLITHTDHSISR